MNKLLSFAVITALTTTGLLADNKKVSSSQFVDLSYGKEYGKNELELSLIDRASMEIKGNKVLSAEGSISVSSKESLDLNTHFWIHTDNKIIPGLSYKFGVGYEIYELTFNKTSTSSVIIKESGAPDISKKISSTSKTDKKVKQLYAETGLGFDLTNDVFVEGSFKIGKETKEVSIKTKTSYDKTKTFVFTVGKTFDDDKDSTNVKIGLEYKFN